MDKAFAEDIPAQLKYLEKLLGDKATFASKITAGDLAVASIFNVLLALEVRRAAPSH
jgi:glutathione S-transferase